MADSIDPETGKALTRRHIMLFEEDYIFIREIWPEQGLSWPVREMVHKYLKALRAKAEAKTRPTVIEGLDKIEELL